MKYSFYPAFILFICTFLTINTASSQSDSLFKTLPPKYEYTFLTSAGLLAPLEYSVIKGNNIIEPSLGYAVDFSFNYSYRFQPKWKAIMGLTVGFTGREYLFKVNDDEFSDYAWIDESVYSHTQNQSNKNLYLAIPLKLAYNVWETKKHQSWLKLGGDLFWLKHKMVDEAYYCTDDLGNKYNIFNVIYVVNPENRTKLRLSAGYEYRYQFKNYNQFSIGVNYAYNFSTMYSGAYEVFPDDNKYYGFGTYTSNLNPLSLEIGYSINNKKKQVNNLDYYKKTKKRRLEIPDSMPNKFELQIEAHLFRTDWFPIQQAPGFAKLIQKQNHIWRHNVGFSMNFMKYFRQNMAYSIGIDYDKRLYSFNVSLDKSVYRKDLPYTIDFNQTYKSITIPIGFQYNYSLNKKSNLEMGVNLFTSYSSSINSSERTSVAFIDSINQEVELVNITYPEVNNFSLGMGLKFAYSIKTKNQNKWGIGCKLNTHLVSHFNLNVDIVQPDNTFESAEIKFKPTYVQGFIYYSFTMKKKRFMKQNGY